MIRTALFCLGKAFNANLFAALALFAFEASHAAEPETEPVKSGMKTLPVKLFVTAEGKVDRIEWTAPEIASDSLRKYLTPLITQIEFEPATLNGKAMTSELLMNAVLQVRPKDDGKGEVQFITLEKTVASLIKSDRINYPAEMLMQGVSAFVVVSAEIGSDGKAIENSIALDGAPRGRDAHRIRAFYREAKRALLRSEFELNEKVGDRLVGGVIRIPYVFCVESCDAINAEVDKIRAKEAMIPSKESGIGLAQMKPASIPADS